MKKLLKITGGILLVLLVLFVSLNLYLNDERLKSMAEPQIEELTGKDVQLNSASLSFISTFPSPGIEISEFMLPGDTPEDTVFSVNRLTFGIRLLSLLGDQVELTEVQADGMKMNYKVYEDSTTNLDFLMQEESEEPAGETGLSVPHVEINNSSVYYSDEVSSTEADVQGINGSLSLVYNEQISSSMDMDISSLTVITEEGVMVRNLPVSLLQESTLDTEASHLELTGGELAISGLALSVKGSLRNWDEEMQVDLEFESASGDFGEILKLVPDAYKSSVEGLETRGELAINGSVNGSFSGDQIPGFNASVQIRDGYLKYPDLPEPVENIQLNAAVNNQKLEVTELNAVAGENRIEGEAMMEQPLEETGSFMLNLNGNLNLSTAGNFTDLSSFDIERMKGLLEFELRAEGDKSRPETAGFNTRLQVSGGELKYAGVKESIRQIEVLVEGSEKNLNVESFSLDAAGNTLAAQGNIYEVMNDRNRSIDLNAALDFNLADIPKFYPLNTDSLNLAGQLKAEARLKGKAEQITEAVESGTLSLKNGRIEYAEWPEPVENLQLSSTLKGNRIRIENGGFNTGDNSFQITGTITDYLQENRKVDIRVEGKGDLKDLAAYYKPEGYAVESGNADIELEVSGPLSRPEELRLKGLARIANLNISGDSLDQPVRNLEADMELSPSRVTLKNMELMLGESDLKVSGSLSDYMQFLKEGDRREKLPHLKGVVKSNNLNLDELIDWSDDSENEEILVELPQMTAAFTAEVQTMKLTGITMTNLTAEAESDPEQIKLNKASVELLDGTATGAFTWEVPQPDRTIFSFSGRLDSLEAADFFEEYKVLGQNSRFHEYISGAFSADADYSSPLDKYFDPELSATSMEGFFGMTKSALENHPLQEKVAAFLRIPALKNLSLNQWKSNFDVDHGKLLVKNLDLTAKEKGLELNGEHSLTDGSMNYRMKVILPSSYASALSKVLTKQVVEALSREDGTIAVPLRATGKPGSLNVKADDEVIKPIVEDYLKDKAGGAVRDLLNKF